MLKLHLGCGEIHLDDFINIDIIKTQAVDKIMDVRKLEYEDNSIEAIYSAHVLEHFTRPEAPQVLKEWYRVLKPGGRLIIVNPNLNRWILRYLLNPAYYSKNKILSIFTKEKVVPEIKVKEMLIGELFGGEPKYDFINHHKTAFTPRIMNKLAKEVGFKKIEKINLDKNYFPIPQVNPKRLHWSSMAFSLTK